MRIVIVALGIILCDGGLFYFMNIFPPCGLVDPEAQKQVSGVRHK